MLHRVNGTWVGSGTVEDTYPVVLTGAYASVAVGATGGAAVYSENTQWGVNGKWLNGSWLNTGFTEAQPELAFGSTASVYTAPSGAGEQLEIMDGGSDVSPVMVSIEADGGPTGQFDARVDVDQSGDGFVPAGGYTDVIATTFGDKWLGSGSVLDVDVRAAGDAFTADGSDTTILARCSADGLVPDGSFVTAHIRFDASPTVPDGSDVAILVDESGRGFVFDSGDTSLQVDVNGDGFTWSGAATTVTVDTTGAAGPIPDGSETSVFADESGAGFVPGAGDTGIDVAVSGEGLVPAGSETSMAVSVEGGGFVLSGSLSDVDIIAVGGPAYIRGDGETAVAVEFFDLGLFTRWVPATGSRMIYVAPKNRRIPVSPDGRVVHVIGSGTNDLTDPVQNQAFAFGVFEQGVFKQ